MSSIHEAFEQFLKLYPFCYGYWKKYADCEKKLAGEDEAAKIFQRGVEAIPLSVDLWLHYINFTMQCVKGLDTALEKTRGCVFAHTLMHCGITALYKCLYSGRAPLAVELLGCWLVCGKCGSHNLDM